MAKHPCNHEREFGELHTDIKYIKKGINSIIATNENLKVDVNLNSDHRKYSNKSKARISFMAGSGWATAAIGIISTILLTLK